MLKLSQHLRQKNSKFSMLLFFAVVRTFPFVLFYKIENVSKFIFKIIFMMKIKILFLVGVGFGQTFLDFENLPKYNETCDAQENAEICEKQCFGDLQNCINTCQLSCKIAYPSVSLKIPKIGKKK